MKQNLLKKLWLQVTVLVALMCTATGAWAQSDFSSDYEGNVTLSTTGGTSASDCKIRINNVDYDGIKAGTGKISGKMVITVPSGTKYLHLHVAAWNGETVTLSVTPEGYSEDIELTSDSNIAGSGTTYTLTNSNSSTTYYKVITFAEALTEDTALTFTAKGGKRFVIWGVTAEEEGTYSPLVSITVDASDATTVFHVGDEFSHEGVVVTANYEDQSTKDVSSKAEFSGYDMSEAGVQEVTVSYTENEVTKTDTYSITVKAPATLTGISLSGDYPTEFTQGDAFSSEGIIVTANYDDQSTKDVTEDATFTGYDMSEVGVQTVTVSYEGKTATYDITVNEYVEPSVLTVDFESDLSTYREWEFTNAEQGTTTITAHGGTYYGTTGGKATAAFQTKSKRANPGTFTCYVSKQSNNTSASTWYIQVSSDGTEWEEVASQSATSMAKGEWVEFTADLSGYSDVYVRLYYSGSTAVRNVDDITLTTAEPKVLESIKLSGEYPTEFEKGDDFSYEGMTVTATYDNGKTADVTLRATFTGYDMQNVGEQTVTVSYTENEVTKTTSYTITVNEPTPSIELGDNEINAFAEGTDGVIIVGYKNITTVVAEVFYCDAEGNAATYDWVAASINGINNLEYIIDANESTEARTAYMKVKALDNEANYVYSELITINQAGVTVDYATLPFAWEGSADEGKSSLEAMNGVTASGLGSDYAASNAPYRVKLDGTGDYIQVQTDCQPVLVSLDVKMLGGNNSSTITVQESADGETFTDVEELTIEGAQNTILYLQTANAFDAATRYVRLYFTKGSNVGLGGIAIEKEFDVATVGEAGYATYVTKHNVSFPKEVEAYIATSTGYDQIKEEEYVSLTKVTSVAKGTPVVLKNKGEFTLTPVADPESAEGNLLKASDGTVEGNGTIYVLAKPAGKEVGFYAVQEGTTVAEGKAYLEVAKPGVKGFVFAFADQADGINEVNGQWSTVNGQSIFNLAGQRIQKMQKGINIVNGKKVVLK